MRDFTTDRLHLLLSSFISAGYGFTSVAGYLHNPTSPTVILRHDVDARPENSLRCAKLENRLGIAGTYYFRAVPGSWHEEIIREIYSLGHEVGYHYEDLSASGGTFKKAIAMFEENLAKLRQHAPVETICMHGSPLSKYDNRLLWEKYNYRDFGISGEPYFDLDFNRVFYLTDTGRSWNGNRFNLRDRVTEDKGKSEGKEAEQDGVSPMSQTGSFGDTMDIICALKENRLPSVIMITVHPQRWNNEFIPWVKELLFQNVKNVVKSLIRSRLQDKI